MLGNEFLHHLNAFSQIEVDNFYAVLMHEIQCAGECSAFADYDLFDSELNHSTGAEITRHQRGVQHRVAKTADSAGIADTIDLGVGDGVVILNSLVVTDRDQLPSTRQRRTDRNSAFAPAFSGLGDSSLHERIDFH